MSPASLRISSIVLAGVLSFGATAAVAQNYGYSSPTYNYTQVDRARQMIVEARQSASLGDWGMAEQFLREASRAAPGFHEIDQARRDIALQRVDRRPASLARDQYMRAIDGALDGRRLGEADRLIAEAEIRFPGDPAFLAYRHQLTQIRSDTGWPTPGTRVQLARDLAAMARQSIANGDLVRADRDLDRAELQAPGLPEVVQTRAYLTRVQYGY